MTVKDGSSKWSDAILSVLDGEEGSSLKVKKMRKLVLLSMQLEEDDKDAKKTFKKTVKSLEDVGDITLDAEGLVSLKISGKKRKNKEEKKSKKKQKKESTDEKMAEQEKNKGQPQQEEGNEIAPQHKDEEEDAVDADEKNKPCKGNPQGVTRLFLGNLPFAVDEASLATFLPDDVTHIKWITDKETGKFYGSAFIEMSTSLAAADAVAMAGSQLMGRPVKINFAPSRPGDKWPPEKKVISGNGIPVGGGGQAGGSGVKAMRSKPDDCVKLFIGNLSYEIDDDAIRKFFDTVDAELKAVRWLHHQESGDFKGCGYAEFWKADACEKAAKLNGKNLLGRPIRIDWAE